MKNKKILLYTGFAALQLAVLFVLPATEGPNEYLLSMLLIGFLPCLVFLIGWLTGLFCGFHWLWPVGVTAFSEVSILLFYGGSIWYFALIFGAIACAAMFFGSLWRKKDRRKQS